MFFREASTASVRAAGVVPSAEAAAAPRIAIHGLLAELDPGIIVAVHLNDFVADRPVEEQTVMERLLPGESGLIDIEGFLRGLARCGYTGPLTAEPTHPRWKDTPADEAAKQTADSISHCLARLRGGAATTSERERHP